MVDHQIMQCTSNMTRGDGVQVDIPTGYFFEWFWIFIPKIDHSEWSLFPTNIGIATVLKTKDLQELKKKNAEYNDLS